MSCNDRVSCALQAFMLLPFHGAALAHGRSISAHLHETTGLSKARISNGRFRTLRLSTLKKIERHASAWLEAQIPAATDPEERERILAHFAGAPSRSDHPDSVWEDWMHQFEVFPAWRFSRSKQIARVIDKLMASMSQACRDRDLGRFKNLVISHATDHGDMIRCTEDPPNEPVDARELARIEGSTDWSDVAEWIGALVESMYIDLLSAFDVEWGMLYFKNISLRPMFPLVLPRIRDDLLLKPKPSASKKNLIVRPMRRLLEFMHAIAYRRYRSEWPVKPASPDNLSICLGVSPADVSNFFDGTRRLRPTEMEAQWQRLLRHCARGQVTDPFPAPWPMILLAMQWQPFFVTDNGKSAFLLDLRNYRRHWDRRHSTWAGNLPGAAVAWPEWLTDQVLPDS